MADATTLTAAIVKSAVAREINEDDPPELRRLAQDAVSRVGQLTEGAERGRIEAAAGALLERLSAKSTVPPAA